MEIEWVTVVLINPSDHRLYFASGEGKKKEMYVRNADGVLVGNGYIDNDFPSNELGMPRANTPDGVTEERAGYGLMLYSSLAFLAARLGYEGVCSADYHRTEEAERWWFEEVERGLAVEVGAPGIVEDHREWACLDTDNVPLADERWFVDQYTDLHLDMYDGLVNLRGELCGTVTFDYTSDEAKECQVLYYAAVVRSGFVLLDGMNQSPSSFPPEVLAGLDLRDVDDVDLIESILEQLISGGVSWSTYQKFVRRNIPVWSQIEPYVPSRKKKALARNPQKPIRNQAAWKDFYGDFVNPGGGM